MIAVRSNATFFLLSILCGLGSLSPSVQAEDSLELLSAGKNNSYTMTELKSKFKVERRTLVDPVYKTKKTFEGFLLKDILTLLPMKGVDEIVFRAADGYAPSLPLALAAQHEALVAFQEKGRNDRWQSFEQGKTVMSPAPFYLLWSEGKDIGEEFPWPYQLTQIEVVNLAQVYDRAYPKNANQAVMKGFYQFKTACIRCHSINLQGGDLAPELNIPQNITEYWNPAVMKKFIMKPASFRLKDKMPSFAELGEEKISAVIDYLAFMKKQKIFPPKEGKPSANF